MTEIKRREQRTQTLRKKGIACIKRLGVSAIKEKRRAQKYANARQDRERENYQELSLD